MAWDPCPIGGFVGVDLFFVLSGFLVSHVHPGPRSTKHGSPARVGSTRGASAACFPPLVAGHRDDRRRSSLRSSTPQRDSMVRDGQAALVYLSNWQFIADSRDYFAADTAGASPFLHFWSLSIEEQFYVVLPLLLLLLLRLRRHQTVVSAASSPLPLVVARSAPPGVAGSRRLRRTPTTRTEDPHLPAGGPACCSRR